MIVKTKTKSAKNEMEITVTKMDIAVYTQMKNGIQALRIAYTESITGTENNPADSDKFREQVELFGTLMAGKLRLIPNSTFLAAGAKDTPSAYYRNTQEVLDRHLMQIFRSHAFLPIKELESEVLSYLRNTTQVLDAQETN